MTQNEIVSHNLQLAMDALTEDDFNKYLEELLIEKSHILNGGEVFEDFKIMLRGSFIFLGSKYGKEFWGKKAYR